MPAAPAPPAPPPQFLTHTYLRVLLVAMPALMLAAVAAAALFLGVWAESLSGYYDLALRDLFVGMLFAIAACMIAYKGNPWEDFSLNVAGFYALIVALVPHGLAGRMALPPGDPNHVSVDAVRVTLGVVLTMAVLFVLFDWRSGLWAPELALRQPLTRVLLWAGVAYLGGFLVLLAWRFLEGATFDWVHLVAAVGLIVSLAMAVSSHAWPERTGCGADEATDRGGHTLHRTYRVIFWAMAAGLPLWGLLTLLGVPYRVLVVELYEIVLFGWFWGLETLRTWPPPRRPGVGGTP